MYKYLECGLDGIILKNGYDEYETEHGKAVGIHNLEGLHDAIGMHLICNKPVLSGKEVRFLRKELELSQVELANLLGTSEPSVRSYENGRTKKTPAPFDRLLRSLYAEKVNGQGEIRELLERIAKLNRDAYHQSLDLEVIDNHWAQAA